MYKATILVMMALMLSNTAAAGIREDWQAVADAVASTGNLTAALKIEEAVNALTDDELERVYGNVDLHQLTENFRATGKALDATDQAFSQRKLSLKGLIAKSAGSPDAEGYPTPPLCPFAPERSNADDLLTAVLTIQIARELLEGAKVLWSGISRGCDETIVVAGFGGNISLSCIPADIVLFAAELVVGTAEAVVEHLNACDAAVDAAEIEGSYERLGHLHSDLEAHDTDIKTQVQTHDTDIKTQVQTHDTDIKAQVQTHDTDIKTQLSAHDADIKALLVKLQATADENQRLLKISMSRQLEILRLLITPEGRRIINSDVLTCVGDNCPQAPEVISCADGLGWPCK